MAAPAISSPAGAEPPTLQGVRSAPFLSVVAPAYDEAETIGAFVEEVCQRLDALGRPYELVCVDDGSADRTPEILRSLRERHPALRPLALDAHEGQSAAIAAGVRASRGEFIALMDADLQNDPADIAEMLRRVQATEGCDCVVGVRTARRDNWLRRLSSRLANRVAQAITGVAVRDAGCGLKLCRADILKQVPFFRGAHRFLPTLIQMEGGRVVEMTVNHRPRLGGRSKYGSGLGRARVALRDALGVKWLMDRKIRGRAKDLR